MIHCFLLAGYAPLNSPYDARDRAGPLEGAGKAYYFQAMTEARPRPKVMTLTDAAAARVREIMTHSEKPIAGLRVGVKNAGCAGMEYTLDYAETPDPLDDVVEDRGVTLYIDPKAVLFLLGTEMDYQVDKLKAGFVFNNPNQTSACGCGESVAITPASEAQLSGFDMPVRQAQQ